MRAINWFEEHVDDTYTEHDLVMLKICVAIGTVMVIIAEIVRALG